MTTNIYSQKISWRSCNREEICKENMKKESYRVITNDQDYINNWVEKLDLLCMPAQKTGLIGSSLFIGIVMSIYLIPLQSDEHGRLFYITASIIVQIIGQTGLILTSNINHAYLFMFCMGLSFPGRSIILYNYTLELIVPAYKQW